MLFAPALIVILMAILPYASVADERIIYSARWNQVEDTWDGWEIGGDPKISIDAKRATVLSFGPGKAVTKALPAEGGHRLRIRFTYTTSHSGWATVLVTQFSRGKELPVPWIRSVAWGNKPCAATPDPTAVEGAILLEEETDSVRISISPGGPAEQRMTLSDFRVVDLGPLPARQIDRREMLADGGWEKLLPRQSIVPENSYGHHTGGWMGWNTARITVTNRPAYVRNGRNALRVVSGGWGFRVNPPGPWAEGARILPDTWYAFSTWAKGMGTMRLTIVGGESTDAFLLSPVEWRQIHLPILSNGNIGVLVNGEVYLDDMSFHMIPPEEVRPLRKANDTYVPRSVVNQTIPPDEQRSQEPVTLHNAHLRVRLSPLGGGHIVEMEDKSKGVVWKDVSLLALKFRDQPIPINWNIPFQTRFSEDNRSVTFSHTVTGGESAPFLDSVRVEHTFSLAPDDRLLSVTFRFINQSRGARLITAEVENSWLSGIDVQHLSASGDTGLIVAETASVEIRNLTAGWMAISATQTSLVAGFDVTAVQRGWLNSRSRRAGWEYLRVPLPPGGMWETHAWIASVPLPAVHYADARVAVQAELEYQKGIFGLHLRSMPLTNSPTRVTPRITDYGGATLVQPNPKQPDAPLRFTPPQGRFITILDITSAGRSNTVELFNDPPDRLKSAGIEGAGQIQYAPTVPVRVIRLPDAGDLRAQISNSQTALLAAGKWADFYPLQTVARKFGLQVEQLDGASGFPEDVNELAEYRVVILCNIGAMHLAPAARAVLSQYVRGGGALLVIGGMHGLGAGQTTGTDLEELLPAALTGGFDLQPLAENEGLLQPVKEGDLEALPWESTGHLFWIHRVRPRQGVTALVRAGKTPVLCEGRCGRGKTILFSGTVHGEPRGKEVAAWEWKGWQALWECVLQRLLQDQGKRVPANKTG